MKQIANGFTLLNLVFGCVAIVAVLQTGLTTTVDDSGQSFVLLPEKIYYASLFIGCAAIVDFMDGFVARLLGISSPMGKQLDSLADIVSFGVAPGMIVYEFLRLSFAQRENGLDISTVFLLPAFILPVAGAFRLARFNLDTSSTTYFKGVPIPAAGLLVASFPLIYWYTGSNLLRDTILSPYFWYILVLLLGYLMISNLPMLSLKIKHFSIRNNWAILLLAVLTLIGSFVAGWFIVLIIFVLYIILSLATLRRETTGAEEEKLPEISGSHS